MKRMVDDKEIRNFDDRITALEQGGVVADAYTKAESDAKFQTISGMNTYATKTEVNSKQDALTVGNGIDIDSNNEISVDNTVVVIDSDHNLNKTLIRTREITSLDGEDSDSKGEITLSSGLRAGSVNINAEGEESGASIYVRGTSAVGSEGIIEINGQTKFNTENRVQVTNGNTTEDIAYLSDIVSSSINVHYIKITDSTDFEVYCTLITNSGTAFNIGTLISYLNNNSLRVTATGKATDYDESNIPALYVEAVTGLTPGTITLAIGMLTSSGVTAVSPTNPTVTDTVITVRAI